MKKSILATLVIAVSFSFSVVSATYADGGKKFGYEGVQTCGMCHKSDKQGEQLKIWQNSAHANAYKALLSDKANEISQKLYKKKAVDAEECLKCHASGYNVDASLIGKKFSVEDGVQCETCHGPGSEYKSMKIMKSKDEAVKNGLKVYDKPEALCVTCHNDKSPTFKSFKFEEMWVKIKHDIPKK